MCYNLRYLTKKQRDYAIRFGESQEEIDKLEKQLELFENRVGKVFHTSAFDHWDLPVITSESPKDFQFFHWGLIPDFVKDTHEYESKYTNRYLNARIETLFEEKQFNDKFNKYFNNPFFEPALHQRCIVVVDGYYDWHWQGSKSYNFHIQLTTEEPMLLAAIWSSWESPSEEIRKDTVCLVTTPANELCMKVHNKPKASEGPRQLAVLDADRAMDWLRPITGDNDLDELKKLPGVYPADKMKAFPVKKLFVQEGRSRIPLNDPECVKQVKFPELKFTGDLRDEEGGQISLF